jgi:C-terminal peptidase prc
MKMVNLVLLTSALSLSLMAAANTAGEEKSLEIQWAPTELKPQTLDNLISEAYCGYEAIRFKGCIAAVEKFGSYVDSNTETLLTQQRFTMAAKRQTPKGFREQQAYQRSKLNAYEAKFSPEAVASLVRLYSDLRKRNPQPKPYQIALPVNESLAIIYDPHKMYQPMFKYDGLNRIRQNPYMGVSTQKVGNRVGVETVFVNTPAELAGVKPGDIITHVNDRELILDANTELESVLNFQDKEEVKLTFSRKGRSFSAKIIFGYYSLSPVVDRVIESNGKKYTYLYLSEIPSDLEPKATCRIFSKILSKFNQQTNGMILDLRNNVGGPGETAACLSGLFVGKDKVIFIDEDITNTVRQNVKSSMDKAFSKKLVVLVNARTASSGELLTAAIQFYGRGLVVGDRTFGKSIGQVAEEYPADRVNLNYTISKAYRPNGVSYQSQGIEPDSYVYLDGLKPSALDLEMLREEDIALFPMKLANIAPAVKKPTSLKFPKDCVNADQVQKTLDTLSDGDWKKDFQLQFALKTLECTKP